MWQNIAMDQSHGSSVVNSLSEFYEQLLHFWQVQVCGTELGCLACYSSIVCINKVTLYRILIVFNLQHVKLVVFNNCTLC